MKITRLISILVLFVMLLSFVSCDMIHSHGGHNSNQNQNQSQGGENEENQGEAEVTYIYSVLSKVIHLPGCYHIDRIKEDYLKETNELAPLFEKGYTICNDCFNIKDDEPEEEEDDKDKISKEDATFVINSSSKKLHHLGCYHVEGMVEKNLEYTDLTLQELLTLEYIPCASCMPEEAKEYEKNHPEDSEK